ncbi:MAG TPA: hypothetical protein VGJ02_04370 [Pyrinomonadaceae bacterium]
MNNFAARLSSLLVVFVGAFFNAVGQPSLDSPFVNFVSKRVEPASVTSFEKFCPINESRFARKVFTEYGAMFVASNDVQLPALCYFSDEASAAKFQSTLKTASTVINGAEITLQASAMASFLMVLDAAKQLHVRISPLDGSIAAARKYSDTVNIWNSRYQPALRSWRGQGKLEADEVDQLESMPLAAQVERVIEWESKGLLFGTGRRSSIFSSTAPPGTSQHLSLIAFDIAGRATPLVTAIFNANGWFQTIKGDPDHFTYLGVFEGELPKRGLKQIYYQGERYWVPDLPDAPRPGLQD